MLTTDTSVEPDAVIASNQKITVSMGVGGTAAQVANIETGVNSTVSVTTGDGNSTVNIEASNTVYTHDLVYDTVTPTGAGGSNVTVATGNGNNSVNVNLIDDGTGNDAGSVVKVTTGSGNDNIVVKLGTAGGTGGIANTANVSAGGGNDRVQFDVPDINSGIVADGGAGTDTIALVSASAGANFAHLAGLSNFEILEVTDTLVNDVNLDAYEPANTINHVILDMGFSGFNTISGAEQNFQLDVMHQSSGELVIRVDNAFSNPNDTVNILLSGEASGTNGFGTIDLNPIFLSQVEFVNLQSTQHTSLTGDLENDLQLEAFGIQTLAIQHNAGGDVSLNLNGSFFGNSLTNVDATGFTGGITENDGALGNQDITFLAPNSGNDNLKFGNGNDHVTLGDGNSLLVFGTGGNTVVVGNGDNTIKLATNTTHTDNVTVGTGNNLIEFTGTGGSGSTINLGAHSATSDTIKFDHNANSQYNLPDVVNGFHTSGGTTDLIDVSAIDGGAGNVRFFVASDAVGVLATVAGDVAGKFNIVYEQDNGHIFIDANGSQSLVAGGVDMQMNLTGLTGLSAAAQVAHMFHI